MDTACARLDPASLTLAASLVIASYCAAMYFSKGSALLLASVPFLAPTAAADVDLAWYPPSGSKVNDLDSALNADGAYGFIYDSSDTPDDKYGTYNWCNMPHVRKREYVQAPAEYELQYVELVHRHHKRTPYASNAFPVEPYHWNCDDQGLFYYGEPFEGHDPSRTYWKGYTSNVNPFVPSGWIGTCQFPQITSQGLDDSWVHGRDLYGVYHDLLGFLPRNKGDWASKVRYRVTNNVITSQVAGMVVNGMWGAKDSVPLSIQAAGIDSLEPQYSCPAASRLFNAIKSSANAAWQDHLTASAGLFATLDDISGVPPSDGGFHASFDHYYDNLSARQCHAKPLPCKLVDGANSTTCVTQALADAVYRLGNWEYSQIYRDAPDSLAASVASYGVWIAELAENLRAAVAGTNEVIYAHNVAHDGSVSRLLSILQLDEMVWPGMGSEVVFELYKKRAKGTKPGRGPRPGPPPAGGADEHYVRVLFNGQVLKSSSPTLGLMDMIPAQTLLAYFDGLVGERAGLVKGLCK
ncbi:uncharacterized protein DNG_08786 [Cephalotrichum gorgonifer]|uniref:Counting factor 60 n=1 Tax=Cephalotrichum gorgonifer TaxID=2041049 RepID=A0AAE8N4T4_9PEZI|nr:uncharacterized protein DNG_08786 [Cephalotrichum gorgonifer]